jgi:hypothetical protein
MKRLILISLSLVLGYGLGLAYAWYLQPARPADTTPASLRADYQAEYVQWVAHAYLVEGDVARAQARLAVLGEADLTPRVIALAQQLLASGGDANTIQALARLAVALGAGPVTPSPAVETVTPTMTATETPTPTATATASPPPTITPIPLPTQRPSPTPIGVLQFVNQQLICEPLLDAPLLQVLAFDANGQFVPGVEVLVEWDGGFDHFFTGLQPEQGAGYGDFVMTSGVIYTVRLAVNPSAAVTNLVTPTCTGGVGAWQLTFQGQ